MNAHRGGRMPYVPRMANRVGALPMNPNEALRRRPPSGGQYAIADSSSRPRSARSVRPAQLHGRRAGCDRRLRSR